MLSRASAFRRFKIWSDQDAEHTIVFRPGGISTLDSACLKSSPCSVCQIDHTMASTYCTRNGSQM